MVTNLITGTDFSAVAVDTGQTAVGDSTAFMQALQQEIATEIPTAEIGTENGALFSTDITEKISELIDIAAQWVNQDSGTSDGKMRILQAIMKFLDDKAEKSEKDDDEKTAVGSLMQIIDSMIEQTKAENDVTGENALPAVTAAEQTQTITAPIFAPTTENAQQLPVTAKQPEETAQQTGEQTQTVLPQAQAAAETVVQSMQTAVQNGEISEAEKQPVSKSIEAAGKTQPTAEAFKNPEAEKAEASEARSFVTDFTPQTQAQQYRPWQAQPQQQTTFPQQTAEETKTPEVIGTNIRQAAQLVSERTDYRLFGAQTAAQVQSADNGDSSAVKAAQDILGELLQLAKDNLGLESAEIVTESEPQQPIFFIQRLVKPQETNDELTQLLAQAQTAKGEAKTQTEAAVKLPQELVETAQQQTAQALPIAQTEPVIQQSVPNGQTVELEQLPQEILSRIDVTQDGKTTLTMKLNPQELGEIEIRVSANQGKISVEIVAQSKQTQTILAERIDNLQTALKENGVELEKYQVIYAPEQNQNSRQNYNGSSKNPYVRQDEENDEDPDGEFAELLAAQQI